MSPPSPIPERYEVLEELGRGGFGAVLRCRDRELDREVAVKLLHRPGSPEARARFAREARVLASVRHPHVLEVYAADAEASPPYLVTELIEGERPEPEDPDEALALMLQVGRGLQALHDAGLVHRDVKPGNILVDAAGRARLLDLGLVAGPDLTQLTGTGAVVGTPLYMAPEVLRGRAVTPAADWYAWGVTLFELIEGRPPFGRGDVYSVAAGGPRGPLELEVLDPGHPAAALLRACLDEDPDVRPRHVDEVLRTRASPPPVRGAPAPRRRRGRLVTLGVGAALVLLAFSLAPGTPPPPPLVPHPPEPRPPGEAERSPFPHDLAARLSRELDAALAGRYDIHGRPAAGPGGLPFHEAYLRAGVAALEILPEHQRVFAWMDAGGDPAGLPSRVLEILARQDRSFEDLDLAPPFHPFHAVLPLDGASPPTSPLLEGNTQVNRLLPAAATGWGRAMLRELNTLAEALADLQVAVRGGERPRDERALFDEAVQRHLNDRLFLLGAGPAGRRALRDALSEVREPTRRFLYAASRALESLADRGDLERASDVATRLEALYLYLDHGTTGQLVTATRAQLFGPPPRSAAATWLQAVVVHDLFHEREPLAQRHPEPVGTLLPLYHRVLRAPLAEHVPRIGAVALVKAMQLAEEAGDPQAVLRLHERYGERFAPALLPDQAEDVKALLARARRPR